MKCNMLYLSVAKMERSSSLPEMSLSRTVDNMKSLETVPAVPAAPSRRPSSSVNVNIVNTLKGITAPEPVFVKMLDITPLNPIPAVRITYTSTQPKEEINIIPLSRTELGEIWKTPLELAQLEITTVPRGWHSALAAFIPHVEYSQDYLSHILSVLRTMQFMNNKPLDLSLWKRACRFTNDMLYVVLTCPSCNALRFLSMRTLYTSSRKTIPLRLTCQELGLACLQISDEIIDVTLPPSSKHLTPVPRQKPQVFALTDALSVEDAPIKNVQSKTMESTNANEYVTWSQISAQFIPNQSPNAVMDQHFSDPYDAIEAGPDHFISGYALFKFKSPDPTPQEVNEYKHFVQTSAWREIFRDFTKWSDAHLEAQYNGEEDIASVFRWSTAMKSRFLNIQISNSIMFSELASATLTHRARSWRLAHRLRTPKLLVTFDQLVEWIKRELVPQSATTDAVNAWSDLTYSGDVKKYIEELERLINHFPLRKESIIVMATKPLGKDIQNRIRLMDLQHGPTGLTLAQLKQAIRGFLSISQTSRYQNRERQQERLPAFQPRPYRPNPQYQIRKDNIPIQREPKLHAANLSNVPSNTPFKKDVDAKSPASKTSSMKPMYTNDPNSYFRKRKVGIGPTPCFVCGDDKHAWIHCSKKKKGRCGCCGSEGHLTRMCAQRYHPEVRMTFHQCMMCDEPEYVYIEENIPEEDSDIEEFDKDYEIVEDVDKVSFHQTAVSESTLPDSVESEIENVQAYFHATCFGIPSSDDSESEEENEPPTQIKIELPQKENKLLPWQRTSPRDYEGHSLEEDLPVKYFEVAYGYDSDRDEPFPNLHREAVILPSALPKRRYKLDFHSDAKPRQHAKVDSKWESQMTFVEKDDKIELIKTELDSLEKRQIRRIKLRMSYRLLHRPMV